MPSLQACQCYVLPGITYSGAFTCYTRRPELWHASVYFRGTTRASQILPNLAVQHLKRILWLTLSQVTVRETVDWTDLSKPVQVYVAEWAHLGLNWEPQAHKTRPMDHLTLAEWASRAALPIRGS